MQITLMEDNSFLSKDGKPTLVTMGITFDNGKSIRLPYEATKTIQELYKDVAEIEQKVCIEVPNDVPQRSSFLRDALDKQVIATFGSKDTAKEKKIEKEDLVKCTCLEKDLDGNVNEHITVGGIYRVVAIIKDKDKNPIAYEVLDDKNKDYNMRIPVLAREVELYKKRVKQPARVLIPDMIKKCNTCGEDSSLLLNKETNRYEGICESCESFLTSERPKAKNG